MAKGKVIKESKEGRTVFIANQAYDITEVLGEVDSQEIWDNQKKNKGIVLDVMLDSFKLDPSKVNWVGLRNSMTEYQKLVKNVRVKASEPAEITI